MKERGGGTIEWSPVVKTLHITLFQNLSTQNYEINQVWVGRMSGRIGRKVNTLEKIFLTQTARFVFGANHATFNWKQEECNLRLLLLQKPSGTVRRLILPTIYTPGTREKPDPPWSPHTSLLNSGIKTFTRTTISKQSVLNCYHMGIVTRPYAIIYFKQC